jgi:hypothetical protein
MSYAVQLRGITAQQAAYQAMPQSSISSTAGFTQTVWNDIEAAAAKGNFTAFNPSGCSGIAPSGAKIVSVAGGLALTGLTTGLSIAQVATTIAAPLTAGASVLVGLFTMIFAHHAQKVQQEQQIVCASVPAASDSLTAIDQAVTSGTITPAQGITALQNLEQAFAQTVAPIIKMDSSHCNAACVWTKMLEAIVYKKSSDYQDLANAQAAAAAPKPAPSAPTVVPMVTAPIQTVATASAAPTAAASPVLPMVGDASNGAVYVVGSDGLLHYMAVLKAGSLPNGYTTNAIHWVPNLTGYQVGPVYAVDANNNLIVPAVSAAPAAPASSGLDLSSALSAAGPLGMPVWTWAAAAGVVLLLLMKK